ncbi:MAG: methyltransferase family protein [Phycisphaerae bacterium]
MAGTNHDVADATPARRGALSALLARIPLSVRAVVYYVIFFVAFILILVPWLAHLLGARFLPATWQIEIGWGRGVGWLIFAIFYVAYTLSSLVLMRRGRGAYVEFDPPKELVATGPFRWCRNPIAACVLGMILGEALAFCSTGIFLLFLVGLPLAHLQVVLLEEPRLEKRFGQTYIDYRARVPRWIPRPPREQSS